MTQFYVRRLSRKRLYNTFQQNYEGVAANWFHDAISNYESMYDATRHNGRVIVCLQSNGYGKTRGIFELMKRVSQKMTYRYVVVDC